jgi:short-subunit dehydrogenase involved in D-alanine esterification of teichoic acids
VATSVTTKPGKARTVKLEHKTILITGGTSGIGFELARQLQRNGNTIIVTGRDHARLDIELVPVV